MAIEKKPRKLNISKELVLDQPQQNQDKYCILFKKIL